MATDTAENSASDSMRIRVVSPAESSAGGGGCGCEITRPEYKPPSTAQIGLTMGFYSLSLFMILLVKFYLKSLRQE